MKAPNFLKDQKKRRIICGITFIFFSWLAYYFNGKDNNFIQNLFEYVFNTNVSSWLALIVPPVLPMIVGLLNEVYGDSLINWFDGKKDDTQTTPYNFVSPVASNQQNDIDGNENIVVKGDGSTVIINHGISGSTLNNSVQTKSKSSQTKQSDKKFNTKNLNFNFIQRGTIYGREAEIKLLLEFLKGDKANGIIIAPSCFGKTYFIRKFLRETTDEIQVKTEHHHLFEKVVYIDCRKDSLIQNILFNFEGLLDRSVLYIDGDKGNFLKEELFSQLNNNKFLLIFDNFEDWLDENDSLLGGDTLIFLESLFYSNHKARTIFISQFPPKRNQDFSKNVETLKQIEDLLLGGLDKKSALEFVRTESKHICDNHYRVDLDKVSDNDLIDFFKKVFYIPQAIESMLFEIGEENITFADFQTTFWNEFEQRERDNKDLDKKLDKRLRPTFALIEKQFSRLNVGSQFILSLLAFFESVVPEEIILDDVWKKDVNALRKDLDYLVKINLVRIEQDKDSSESKTFYFYLHPFIKKASQIYLPKFEVEYETHLENLSNQMDNKTYNAWENKLFNKQFALVECWEKIEDYFVKVIKRADHQEQRDEVDFNKALAISAIAKVNAKYLTDEQIKQLRANAIKIYQDYLKKNPNDAVVYNNLGNLLAKDESRWAEAESAYKKAIEINPNDADAYYNLGNLLAKDESRWAEAESAFKKSLEINPNIAEAYGNFAYYKAHYVGEKAKDEIIENLRKCVELNPMHKEFIKNNFDVDFIRNDPRFKEIVGDDD